MRGPAGAHSRGSRVGMDGPKGHVTPGLMAAIVGYYAVGIGALWLSFRLNKEA